MTRRIFILIPGAGGSAWYWHLVVPRLERIGHEAVPVTLPAADDAAGLPEYADAVVRAIGDREPRHVVIVAQPLGGFTAPVVCQQISVALLILGASRTSSTGVGRTLRLIPSSTSFMTCPSR